MDNVDDPQVLYTLKAIPATAIPSALDKARQYRVLGQAAEAESICLDILACDAALDEARVLLLLALTDQFAQGRADLPARATELLPRLKDDYERHYYEGIICERHCKALLHKSGLRSRHGAYDLLLRAMRCYAAAELIRPPDNAEALLRWNSCIRMLSRHPYLEAAQDSPEVELE